MDVSQIKASLEKRVKWRGSTNYKLVGVTIKLSKQGEYYYAADIQDINSPWGVVVTGLEDINVIE